MIIKRLKEEFRVARWLKSTYVKVIVIEDDDGIGRDFELCEACYLCMGDDGHKFYMLSAGEQYYFEQMI